MAFGDACGLRSFSFIHLFKFFSVRKSSTIQLGLALLGLFPAGLHAQSSEHQAPLERALLAQAQWAKSPLTAADVRLSSAYAEPNGLEHVYVQQVYRDIPVYNRLATLAFANGRLATHASNFVLTKQLAALSTTPTLTAAGAVSRTLLQVAPGAPVMPAQRAQGAGTEARHTFSGAGIARRDIEASLTWVIDEAGRAHLAWNVNVQLLQSPDWWNVRVDAATGLILEQDNWTVNEVAKTTDLAFGQLAAASVSHSAASRRQPPPPPTTTTATYLVTPFPREDPNRGGLQVDTNPWLKAGAGNNATTYGWHFDGTTNYDVTRGNNVSAYDDSLKMNAPGRFATSTTPAPSLTFQYAPTFSSAPTTTTNRRAATVNLFYWNNIVHDLTYQYGFTEAAGNFQADNMGRGGVGNDYVKAEAQDGSGKNNANFSAPPDGRSGTMQMFLFNALTSLSAQVTAPAAIAGSYQVVESGFSTENKLTTKGPLSGQLGLYVDAGSSPVTSQACVNHSGPALTGKIALLYRGTCDFTTKVKNAQLAGAIGAVVINNAAGAPISMSGTDNTITIPAVMVSDVDGARLASQVANGVQITLPRPAAGQLLDGDFDSGVMAHEYGHGVSIRLTGGPANSSCLDNAEQGGEGWSDYLALMMTTDWSTAQITDGPKVRPTGTYLTGVAGIRTYPYSTSLTVNPLTYTNVAANPEVHAIGEVWCAALWDMTWNIIKQRGTIEPDLYKATTNGGNVIALQLMMQGLKLQTCRPGFLDSRDAILAADSLLYKGEYHAAIWNAFARRGMGYDAVQGSSSSATDQVAGFNMPPPASLDRVPKVMIGNAFDVTLNVRSGLAVPTTAFTLTDDLPAGMVFGSSSTGGTLAGNKVTFSNITFNTVNQVKTMRFQAYADPKLACTPTLPINDDRDQNKVGGLFNQTDIGSGAWVSSTARARSGAAWYAPDIDTKSDFTLTSNLFSPTGMSLLSFYHYYDLESVADGGTVEISTDLGSTWMNAAPYFLQNGYTSAFDPSVVPTADLCFSGQSASGGNNTFIRSIVDLRSFIGQGIQIRFRMRTDTGNPGSFAGWFVDDIQVINGCGGNQHIELRDANGVLQGAPADIVTLLLPGGKPTATKTLAQSAEFAAHPNPFGAAGLRLALTLPIAQPRVSLTLTDVTGRVLLRRTIERLATGPNAVQWPEAAALPAGLYLVQLQLPDGSSRTLRVERE